MADAQFSLDVLLADLQAAKNPAARAAVVAEMAFDDLDEVAATVARRCIILHWFDQAVIAALLVDLLPAAANDERLTQAARCYAQLQRLAFVEGVGAARLTYHDLTREGLVNRYAVVDPDLLRTGARLAAAAFLAAKQDEVLAGEALYCLVVAGEQDQAVALLDEMLYDAGGRQDWQAVISILGLRDEAESYSFVEALPRGAHHYLASGLARKAQNDLAGAIADYDQAIALNPEYPEAFGNRGLIYRDQGNLDEAIANFGSAIQLFPDGENKARAYNLRGNAYRGQGNFDAAVADYDQAIALNPDDATAYNNRGNARYDQNDLAGAIADYDQAIALNPEYATAFYNRGIARADQHDLAGAIADYDQAIALNPDDATAYNNRGNVRYDQHDLAGAIADYDQAIALNPEYATAYNNRGNVYRDQGNLSAAIKDYDQAIALNPNDASAYYSKGTTLRALGKWADAQASHEQALIIDPTSYLDLIALADMSRRVEDVERWQTAIEQARPLVDVNDPYNAACFESIAGNPDDALKLLTQAIERTPSIVDWARQDPDLHWLHDDPRFWALVGTTADSTA